VLCLVGWGGGGGGGGGPTPAEVHLMDDPGIDPAVQAAADVKWWFLQASGLQRLVDLGDEVRGEEDPEERLHDSDAPRPVPPPHETDSTGPSEPPT